ncbi:conserved hypothetical protein [Ricinus communis]|uniref:Uncharacterized protein n=1 Tax=Ricinus communis TaxID=3988 RepID=B9S3L0_RICCO|nr:conserved hypothetical protein [Ricinus communis]
MTSQNLVLRSIANADIAATSNLDHAKDCSMGLEEVGQEIFDERKKRKIGIVHLDKMQLDRGESNCHHAD